MKTFRSLDDDELISVLLGETVLDDVITYHKEEIDALAAIESPEERALAYPGRGGAVRKYAGRSGKLPSSWGFDFLVYAVKKDTAARVSTSKAKTPKKKSNKKK